MVQRSGLNALLYDGLEDTWLSSVVSSFGKAVKLTYSCKLPLCSDLCIVRRISHYSVSVIDSISSIDFLPFIQFRAVGAEAYGSSNRARGRVDHGQATRLTSMLTYTPTVNLESPAITHAFGVWEEARVHAGNPHRRSKDLNLGNVWVLF